MSTSSESSYYVCYLPDHQTFDTTSREMAGDGYTWIQSTIIEDEDLTFGGKALSTWYEEERRRLSSGSDDGEERRGREREHGFATTCSLQIPSRSLVAFLLTAWTFDMKVASSVKRNIPQ
ncbi:hypothetical protein BGZ63DRAFT_453263 [Mariannaea sp. PMI_226]|nr:hypothetical protein BGZ63DRAFT_453263 [Mariannaea sp. PMI_226]